MRSSEVLATGMTVTAIALGHPTFNEPLPQPEYNAVYQAEPGITFANGVTCPISENFGYNGDHSQEGFLFFNPKPPQYGIEMTNTDGQIITVDSREGNFLIMAGRKENLVEISQNSTQKKDIRIPGWDDASQLLFNRLYGISEPNREIIFPSKECAQTMPNARKVFYPTGHLKDMQGYYWENGKRIDQPLTEKDYVIGGFAAAMMLLIGGLTVGAYKSDKKKKDAKSK